MIDLINGGNVKRFSYNAWDWPFLKIIPDRPLLDSFL